MGGRARARLVFGAAVVVGASVTLAVGSAQAADTPRHQGPCADAPVVGGLLGRTPLCPVVDPVLEVLDPVLAPVTQAVAPVTEPVDAVVAKTGLGPQSTGATGQTVSAAPAPAAAPLPPEPASGPFVPADFDLSGAPQVGAFNFSGAGLYDYSSLLGGAARFGELQYGDLFNGYAPEFGMLGAEDDSAARDVAAAGRAQALDTDRSERIALPILMAVLMLSAGTAGLLRSWVHGSARNTAAASSEVVDAAPAPRPPLRHRPALGDGA